MTSPTLPIQPEPMRQRLAPLRGLPADRLLIHEIFSSIQGESTFQGRPCTFVRTTACHLRCRYCDTTHAFHDGTPWSIPSVMDRVREMGIPLVEVTGGEPLLQRAVPPLMTQLCDQGFTVLLETSGAVSTRMVDPRVHVILDVKTPSSGESARNLWSNLTRLRSHDEVKFVIGSRADFEWSVEVMTRHGLAQRCAVLFSAVSPELEPAQLAEWVVSQRLPVRFQVQLHKVLWGDKRGV